MSQKLSAGKISITPRGVPKAFLQEENMVHIELEPITTNNPLASSEQAMHKIIYHKAEHAKAVVHAHPPYATAWGTQKSLKFLPEEHLSEGILACGSIPITPYARPGTVEMGEVLTSYLPDHRVMILAHHGAITWGESLPEAYFAMERLEHIAKTLYLAYQLGQPQNLPKEECLHLHELRQKIGPKVI